MLMALYCIFTSTVREEKITWSSGSMLYIHLKLLGVLAQLLGLAEVRREASTMAVSLCQFIDCAAEEHIECSLREF